MTGEAQNIEWSNQICSPGDSSDSVTCHLSHLDLSLLKSEVLFERFLISREFLSSIACQNLSHNRVWLGKRKQDLGSKGIEGS